MRTALGVFTTACCLAAARAQDDISSPMIPSVSQIAAAIGQTGLVPEEQVELAATFLNGVIESSLIQSNEALSRLDADSPKRVNPELFYSYGRSPPVFPSPEGSGDGDWTQAYTQARMMVADMTDEEKNNITIPMTDNRNCSGFSGSVDRLGFPGLCLNDGPSGFRGPDNGTSSGFPAQLVIGASWNRTLAYERSFQMGKEFKAKGVNVALGPVAGPLGRVAKGGRNWEGFSNDPYLAGELMDPAVRGLQQSVIACVKHFIANEQETQRNPFLQGFLLPLGLNLNSSVSSNVDDRTMHETYLWPFYDAVYAGVGSVMCSYQNINGSYGCQNSKILNGLLKQELGFRGFVVSDWYAQHTGIAAANAGMDLAMPTDLYWGNNTLATAVRNGSVDSTRLDDMATRILAAWYRYAPLEDPGVTSRLLDDARDPESARIALQAAIEGHVLVKNVNNALPLKRPSAMSIFGWDAVGGLNTSESSEQLYAVSLTNTRTFTNGGEFGQIQFLTTFATIGQAGNSIPEVAFNGTLITGGGSGGIHPVVSVAPYDALLQQSLRDDTTLYTDFTSNQDPEVQTPEGPCLVLINAQSTEAADRSTLADEYSDTLVNNVANKCSNTIVIIHNAGIRLVDRWIDHENVTAAIFAHPAGQASGDALVEALYGRQSFSGRLPYTVARRESDYGNLLGPDLPTEEDPQYAQSNFTEGVFLDYRHFIQNDIEPRFAFGFGLTYTTFDYSDLRITVNETNSNSLLPEDAAEARSPPEGGLASLYEVVATATITVRNTGSVAAAEVAQLYVTIPNSGVETALRGFDKKLIEPDSSADYSFPLRRRDLSIWNVETQQWEMQNGTYVVRVGKSVLDIVLEDRFTLDGSEPEGGSGRAGSPGGGSEEGVAARLAISSIALWIVAVVFGGLALY